MDREQVAAAVHEQGRMLRADGGDLILVDVDPHAARIHLRLARRIPGEFELVLDDPRLA
jgi:Fe-S cluster biogenesis protein NfuA